MSRKFPFNNIVLFVIDTLRADHLGCYGYRKNTSPFIDFLARKGILFLNHYGSDVPTQPGHTALLSGTRGIKTGVISHDPRQQTLDQKIFWLPRYLGSKGWRTVAVSTLQIMKGWFVNGFHEYLNPVSHEPSRIQQVDADEINYFVVKWLRKNEEEKFFMYIHYWDPHMFYSPPRKYSWIFYDGKDPLDPENKSLEQLKRNVRWCFQEKQLLESSKVLGEGKIATDINWYISQYDGEIRYVDDSIKEVYHILEDQGLLENTLIIITSDHGETFGRPKIFFDHGDVSEPVIRLPLIFYHSSLTNGLKLYHFTQSIDVASTILDFLGLDIPQNIDGISLVPILDNEKDYHRKYIYSNTAVWTAQRAILWNRWKLVVTYDEGFWDYPRLALYDLEKDRFEENNVFDENKDMGMGLFHKLSEWLFNNLGKRIDPVKELAQLGLPSFKWVRRVCIEKGEFAKWKDFIIKRSLRHPESLSLL